MRVIQVLERFGFTLEQFDAFPVVGPLQREPFDQTLLAGILIHGQKSGAPFAPFQGFHQPVPVFQYFR